MDLRSASSVEQTPPRSRLWTAVTNDGDGSVDLVAVGAGAGGDGVETRRERWQHGDQVRGIVKDAGIVVKKIDEAAVVGVLFEV